VASAGLDAAEDLTSSNLVITGKPQPGSVVTAMLETQKPAICNDIAVDMEESRERIEAVERGYRSRVALPLLVGGRVVAAFCLYAREVDSFNTDEISHAFCTRIKADRTLAPPVRTAPKPAHDNAVGDFDHFCANLRAHY